VREALQADADMLPSALLSWAASHLTSEASIVVITARPDDALPAVIASLVRSLVSVSALLLYAPSFDPRAPDVSALADEIRAAGARSVLLRRDGDLAGALADVIARD
jgi:hypothetical protein